MPYVVSNQNDLKYNLFYPRSAQPKHRLPKLSQKKTRVVSSIGPSIGKLFPLRFGHPGEHPHGPIAHFNPMLW